MGKSLIILALACCVSATVWAGEDPTSLEFARLASRRFMLDNELTLCEYAPKTAVAADVQYPVLTNGLTVVGGYWPAAHYRLRVVRLPAELAFATKEGEVALRFPVRGGGSAATAFRLLRHPERRTPSVGLRDEGRRDAPCGDS